MTAHKILLRMLDGFREAVPGVEFREAMLPLPAGRFLTKPLAVGSVGKETVQGDGWEARIVFTVFLPKLSRPAEAEGVVQSMAAWVKENEMSYTGAQRGGITVDKPTGLLLLDCSFLFASSLQNPGQSGKARYPVSLNGTVYQTAGWKVSHEISGKTLTAIGEDEPFYREDSKEDRIEIQGLPEEARKVPEDFTLRLGEEKTIYTGCRWKSTSSAGNVWVCAGGKLEMEEG